MPFITDKLTQQLLPAETLFPTDSVIETLLLLSLHRLTVPLVTGQADFVRARTLLEQIHQV